MKIYVATSFLNIAEAREVMEALKDEGHTITHDWTHDAIDPSHTTEEQYRYLQKCGARDYEGVRSADVLVLVNHEKSRDAMTELGLALGMQKWVFVLYPDRRPSVFFHRADLEWTVEGLLAALDDLKYNTTEDDP